MDFGSYNSIYERAKPYLDTRHNDVHTALSYDFAERLLRSSPQADPAVVLPAIILHDVGWKMIPEDLQLKAFGPRMSEPDLRRRHELEGARIARQVLTGLNYDPQRTEEIVVIIEGHDSREEALSLNDGLVKDADKLWRFTPTGIAIDHERFQLAREGYVAWLTQQIDGWFFTGEAKDMARALLAAR